MKAVNNYIIVVDDDEEKQESKFIDIINTSSVILGLIFGYFGMNYKKLGPGDFYKSKHHEEILVFISLIIIGIVSIYYYHYE